MLKCYFIIVGNRSILSYYFTNSSLDYKSVVVELINKEEPFYVYSIEIYGSMTSCKSYLGINVYDKTSEFNKGDQSDIASRFTAP